MIQARKQGKHIKIDVVDAASPLNIDDQLLNHHNSPTCFDSDNLPNYVNSDHLPDQGDSDNPPNQGNYPDHVDDYCTSV